MRTELSEFAEKVYYSNGYSARMDKNPGMYYKVGCNFSDDLIPKLAELNKKYKGKAQVKELFGSDNAIDYDENGNILLRHGALTARPDWRVQHLDRKEFAAFVKKALDAGIVFNYTLNSIQPYGSKIEMLKHRKQIVEFIGWLESIGVFRVTVANPMMMMFVREASSTLRIEVSCITHIDTVTQIKYLYDQFHIDKVCCSILKNRNKKFLKNASKFCNENNITFELLANEMCGNGGDGYATHCVYRDSCYLCHATNVTKEDSMAYHNYPMQFCMTSRNDNKESWLKMRWIRPEDQKYYQKLGLNYFKVSGRTGSTDYVIKTLESYMAQSYNGNLIELWKPLETITNGQKESEFKAVTNIPNKKLDGFIDHWIGDNVENFDCADEICGTTCNYCHNFYNKHILNK